MASWLDDDLGGQTLSREILTLAGPEVKLLDRSLAAFPRGLRPLNADPQEAIYFGRNILGGHLLRRVSHELLSDKQRSRLSPYSIFVKGTIGLRGVGPGRGLVMRLSKTRGLWRRTTLRLIENPI